MNVILAFCLVVVIGAAFIVLVRAERGPSMLDRAVAMDVITAALIAAVAIIMVGTHSRALIPVIAALALVGFISTVTIARFVSSESSEERRILTRDELKALLEEEEQLDDDAAPVHDIDALEDGEAIDFDAIRDGGSEQ